MKRLAFFFSCLCLGAVSVHAQNWPQFRGPGAAGVVEGSPAVVAWDAEKLLNTRWKTAIPGLGHSSPVVWGNKVFVTTAVTSGAKDETRYGLYGDVAPVKDDPKHTWKVYALDKQTGKILWERIAYEGVPKVKRHPKSTHSDSTPVTNGKYLVALFGSHGLYAYDLNGKLLWKQDIGMLDSGWFYDADYQWEHGSSPVIYRDLVIVQADGHKQSFIAAFNLKDGKQAWRVERNEITSWTTPSIYQGKDRTELIANGGRYIRGYDPLTGKELWRFSDNDTQVKMQAPLIANDLIYITGGYPAGRAMYVFRPGASGDISLKSGEDTNAFLAWTSSKGSPYTPTPIVYGDQFYVIADNGVLSSYDAKTGALIYQQRLPSSFSASPVAADGKLYLASEDGEVFVVKAGRQYELIQKNVMGQPLMATPALTQGMIIVRADNAIYALGERKTAQN